MRKIVSALILLYIATVCEAQFPVTTNQGSTRTLIDNLGGLRGKLINAVYADTATANLDLYFKNYDGAAIATYSGGVKFWIRYTNRWYEMSGGGTGQSWLLGGNTLTNAALEYFGSNNNQDVNIGTNGLKRLSISASGILPTAGTVKPVGIDSVTGYLSYVSSGSGSTNISVGSGYKVAIDNTNNVKSLTAGLWLIADSVTANQVNYKADSSISGMSGYFLRRKDSAVYYVTPTQLNTKQNRITLTTNGVNGVSTLSNDTLNVPNYTGGNQLGTIINTDFTGSSLPSGLTQTGFAFTQYNGLRAAGGTTDYFSNNIQTTAGSASMNVSVMSEFTLKTAPTANTEGLGIGRLSQNSFYRLSIIARPYYVDATHWTVGLYWVDGFTEKLIATPLFGANISMTTDTKYRMSLTYNYPSVGVVFERIDSTKSQYQDVIESVQISYTYSSILSTQPIVPNTGGYSLSVTGSSPSGVYWITKFNVTQYDLVYPDMAIMGNSITVGYNTSATAYRWLNRAFLNSFKRYTTFAGPSDRTADMLLRLNELFNTYPQFILWEVGWNDISSSVGSATFSANLSKLLDSAAAHGIPQAVLRLPQTAFGYDTAFINVCNRHNVQLIDVGNLLDATLDAFGIHPNDYGNQILANVVKSKLPTVFGTPNTIDYEKNNNTLYKNISSTGSTATDYTNIYYIDATSANIQFNLFTTDASFIGKSIKIIRTDNSANTITIATFGGTTINGSTTLVVCPNQYDEVVVNCISSSAWVTDLNSSGGTSAISSLTAATGTNSINNAGYQQTWNWNAITSSGGLNLSGSGSLTNNEKTLSVSMGGVGSGASYSTYISNTSESSGTVYGIYSNASNSSLSATASIAGDFVANGPLGSNIAGRFSASGGTNNYALIVPASSGLVGIGTSTPDSLLTVQLGAWFKRGVRASSLPNSYGDKQIRWNSSTGSLSYIDTLVDLTISNLGSTGDTLVTNPSANTIGVKRLIAGNNAVFSVTSTDITINSLSNYTAKTSNYTATSTDCTIDCTSGTFTITLPTAAGITGKIYVIKNSGGGVITIDGNGSELIDGATTQTLPIQYMSLTIQSTGSGWVIL